MDIIPSKYKTEDIQEEIRRFMLRDNDIRNVIAPVVRNRRQIRITLAGIMLISLVASGIITITGGLHKDYIVFYTMCAIAFVFVFFYGRHMSRQLVKDIDPKLVKGVNVMTEKLEEISVLLEHKKQLEELEKQLTEHLETCTKEEKTRFFRDLAIKDTYSNNPILRDGKIRFDIFDDAIDDLFVVIREASAMREEDRKL